MYRNLFLCTKRIIFFVYKYQKFIHHVVLFGEVRLARMRSPEQATYVCAPLHELAQHHAELGPRTVEPLIEVASPIGEVYPITGLDLAELFVEPAEVFGAVDKQPARLPSVQLLSSLRRRSISVARFPRSRAVETSP